MGSPKPLLPVGGSTYLQHVLATLTRAPVGPVLTVLGCQAPRVIEACALDEDSVVLNEDWERGMASSLQAGLRALQVRAPDARAALVALVDTPRFAVGTVTALVTTFLRTAAPVVLPVHDGRHGHPVLFARTVWEALLRLGPDEPPSRVVEAYRDRLEEAPVDDPWILRDADTPAEHERLRAPD